MQPPQERFIQMVAVKVELAAAVVEVHLVGLAEQLVNTQTQPLAQQIPVAVAVEPTQKILTPVLVVQAL